MDEWSSRLHSRAGRFIKNDQKNNWCLLYAIFHDKQLLFSRIFVNNLIYRRFWLTVNPVETFQQVTSRN